jgi:2-haloacid dehalogenase
MGIEAVVFDLGGVLIDWNPRHLYRAVFASEDEMERFLGSVCTLQWHYQHDLGQSMSVTLPEQAERFPEYRAQIMLWADQDAMVGGAVAGVVEVLRGLRARSVPCFAITNWPSESFSHVRDRFDFLGWFDGVVVSGEERVAKPDPRIFRLLLDRYGLDASSTLFIDDSPGHIAAAADIGFVTHVFHTADELTTTLVDLELL